MLITLPVPVALAVDATTYTTWCFISGWWYRRKPPSALDGDRPLLRLRTFEASGAWYERRLRIKRWKDHLPETGGRGGGISKRHLLGHTPEDLDRFGAECRRGELTHWAIVWATPVYRLWNTPETFVLVAGCSIVGAAPCIAVLRYNRARLQHLGVAA